MPIEMAPNACHDCKYCLTFQTGFGLPFDIMARFSIWHNNINKYNKSDNWAVVLYYLISHCGRYFLGLTNSLVLDELAV